MTRSGSSRLPSASETSAAQGHLAGRGAEGDEAADVVEGDGDEEDGGAGAVVVGGAGGDEGGDQEDDGPVDEEGGGAGDVGGVDGGIWGCALHLATIARWG